MQAHLLAATAAGERSMEGWCPELVGDAPPACSERRLQEGTRRDRPG